MSAVPGPKLRRSIVCPNCWREFPSVHVRFIAESPALRGDPVAGPSEALRFRPMRFDASGSALDPEGARCTRMACPHCHAEFPRALLELRSTPISVVGAPGSGKTTLLAAGMWGLSRRAADFGLELFDADPRFNMVLHRNESILFDTQDPAADVTLPKTDVGGNELYRVARVGGRPELLPRPAYFVSRHEESQDRSLMVLYDNAGEHFLPGAKEASAESSTRHLERSTAIVIVFDPIQDARFRRRFAQDFEGPAPSGHERQEIVLSEAIARVRRLRSLDPAAPISIPLVIALTKADEWAPRAIDSGWSELDLPSSPQQRRMRIAARIREADSASRDALAVTSPEFVATAAALAEQVHFVPCSALGCSPIRRDDGAFHLQAGEIRPRWAEMPFVLAIALSDPAVAGTLAKA
jgi:hypothetical protein